jgi:hypothetical protein
VADSADAAEERAALVGGGRRLKSLCAVSEWFQFRVNAP